MSEAALDDQRWSVLLDIRHPLAYLALGPTLALRRELAVEINWLPVSAPVLRPPSRPGPNDDRGVRHRRFRAQALAREIEVYAAAQGLVVRDVHRDGDRSAAYLAWLWLRAQQPEVLEPYLLEAFRAYWAAELDVGNEDAVVRLLASLGADVASFRAWARGEGRGIATRVADEIAAAGISRVPCLKVDAELFIGRQHLPMVRWLLEGRPGRGPI